MRTDLNVHARETLAAAAATRAEWIREWWGPDATTWRGDRCGCSDDRCIGYHHDEQRTAQRESQRESPREVGA